MATFRVSLIVWGAENEHQVEEAVNYMLDTYDFHKGQDEPEINWGTSSKIEEI